ncbi:response regulator transcription factor [Frankia tisae]|uniref:response regulator transcription factor n=1 Tax=Frankia tisae TaxID=2950104 RepID=UPI0021C059B6|nr:response regulator transcription factor [Frankia tisae]
MSLRVVLAEDSLLVREGVRMVLEASDDVTVVATCGDLDGLLAAVDTHTPDVVVTDVRMPPGHTDEGIRAAGRLRATHPGLGVVVLSAYAAPAYALALLEKGSAGRAYLLKERVDDPEQLAAAVRAVASGGSAIDPTIIDLLVAARSRAHASALAALTTRERQVLEQVAQGKSNAAVADALFLSEHAVEKHTNALFAKLGLAGGQDVNRRVKAVLIYLSARGESVTGP